MITSCIFFKLTHFTWKLIKRLKNVIESKIGDRSRYRVLQKTYGCIKKKKKKLT